MNPLITLLASRTSYSQLKAPAPTASELAEILEASLRVPDHLQLRPWRFLAIRDAAREKLGDLFVQAEQQNDSKAAPEKLEKLRSKALRAPLILVGICSFQENDKVPEREQQISTACVLHNIGLALFSLGYGSVWRTGKLASDPLICQGLGLSKNESIVGYLYIGTPATEPKARKPVALTDHFQEWH